MPFKFEVISNIVKDALLKLADQKVTLNVKAKIFIDDSINNFVYIYRTFDLDIERTYNLLMEQEYTLFYAQNAESMNILLQYQQSYLDTFLPLV